MVNYVPSPSTTLSLKGVIRIASICPNLTYILVLFDARRRLHATTCVDRDAVVIEVFDDYAIESPIAVAEFLSTSFLGVSLRVKGFVEIDDPTDKETEWDDASRALDLIVRGRKAERLKLGRVMQEKDKRLKELEQQVLALQNAIRNS